MPTERLPGSSQSREALIIQHLPQVRLIARRLMSRIAGNVQLEDLISAGVLGLISAIDKYDPGKHTQLKTYADHRIRGSMLDALRSADFAKRNVRRKAKAIEQALQRLQQTLGRAPEEDEIAQELSINLDEYWEWLTDVQNTSLEFFDAPLYNDEEARSLSELIPGPSGNSPDRLCERNEALRLLSEAIRQLPEREKHVLSLYFQHEVSPSEIAQIMNLRPPRVAQLKAQALMRLRNALEGRIVRRT